MGLKCTASCCCHGKSVRRGWWKPYTPASPHIMFSFSKSLASTAIGFAEQEGLLSLDDRLVDIFPEKVPENPGENLKKSHGASSSDDGLRP